MVVAEDEAKIEAALRKYWGYDSLRPLQREAIEAGVEQRDSLVVLPTGGGKSLCYQVPPLVAGRVDVVVSPLISLMKDQVDALRACGYPAIALHSGLSDVEQRQAIQDITNGKYRLLFVAPERLLTPWFLALVGRLGVSAFAIDEAHCISQWGHDFRPEYRRLAALKERFPEASIHAFTATATPRVRQDIIRQLRLDKPSVLIGDFDRPNLVYRVIPRAGLDEQVLDVIQRHAGEAVIVYCISRKDTERLADILRERGVNAAPYHAGMDARMRTRTQEAFAAEKIDVIVATVAFGMGIDRSNVRCVVHAAMPKSIEHYQQETGRAGRDGLEAECVLFHAPSDFRRWESILRRSEGEPSQAPEFIDAQVELVAAMQRFASSGECRHRALSRYFGQEYAAKSCGACDVCLGERQAPEVGVRTAKAEQAGWEGVDRGLFERLRVLRRSIADERQVAAFIIFGDATLRELARLRPTTLTAFRNVKGVGERKLAECGPQFVAEITAYCREHGISGNVLTRTAPKQSGLRPIMNDGKRQAFALFEQGCSLEEAAAKMGRAHSTTVGYLEDYVAERKPASVDAWVGAETYKRVVTAAKKVGGSLLRPVFEELGEQVSYEDIRVVMRHASLR
jgi:ATP-dependent DNA helicase RecQ